MHGISRFFHGRATDGAWALVYGPGMLLRPSVSLLRFPSSPVHGRLLLSTALLLSACASQGPVAPAAAPTAPASTTPGASSPAGSTASPASGTAPQATPAGAPQAPPFDTVIRGAERQDGLLPLWRRQDRIWIELSPGMLGKPLFLSPKLASGIGEGGLLGGLMQSRWAPVGRPQWVEFRRVQQQIQLVAVNAAYTAQSGTPQARAVQSAFSPSLISAVPVASLPDAKGNVLVDASALFMGDVMGLALQLQRQYRQGYAFDPRQSVVAQARQVDRVTVFEVSQHFMTPTIAATVPTMPGAPVSTVPTSVPDPRSLFVQVHYSLSALPEQPMATRPADPRVGYFPTTVSDFTQDFTRTPRKQLISRWRLEKQDAQAALSPPVRPIVFWLDPSIPEAYRPTITEGVLAWNQAFERIGYKDAIRVLQAPSDGSFDTLATGHAAIRWMTNAQPSFGAIGPTHVDPRTGEILDAHIGLESLSSRGIRTLRSQILPGQASVQATSQTAHDALAPEAAPDTCQHAEQSIEQLALGLQWLDASRPLDPDDPQVQAFVLAYLKDVTMHEVGHTLGLRHNFRASRWRTEAELNDPVLGKEKGNSASVMDYAPVNLPRPGHKGGVPFQTTLGPYDFWAIEYGYGDLPADPVQAARTLREIAQRSAQPEWADALAYGTDEDNFLGVDPQALTFDLGRDPAAFARTRLAIVQDLFERTQQRVLSPIDDAAQPRRIVGFGLREIARTNQILLRQVGGVVTRRDAPGSRRDLLDPLPAAAQREALDLLVKGTLAPGAVRLPPELLRRLATDFSDAQGGELSGLERVDFSIADQMLSLRRAVLAPLMSEALAARLLDNRDKTRDREARPLLPQALYQQLYEVIWSKSATAQPDEASWQRDLQREHVNRLAAWLLRPGTSRADVLAVQRQAARQVWTHLRAQVQTGAATMPAGNDASVRQAHLQACLDTLQGALQASVVKTGP